MPAEISSQDAAVIGEGLYKLVTTVMGGAGGGALVTFILMKALNRKTNGNPGSFTKAVGEIEEKLEDIRDQQVETNRILSEKLSILVDRGTRVA